LEKRKGRISAKRELKSVLKTDVLVVGGGPCGSYSAFIASKRGVKVSLCEDHSEVGVPRHCAGHISLSGLARLELDPPPESIENEIKGARFYSQQGEEFTVRLKAPVTYVIDREIFDKHLARMGRQAGVEYNYGTKVRSFLIKEKLVKGITAEKEGRAEVLESKIVIDAEGAAATLLRRTGFPAPELSKMVSSVQIEAECIEFEDKDMVEVYISQKFAHGLFAWVIPKRDGSARIGLASNTGNVLQNLKEFLTTHPVASKKLKHVEPTNPSFHLIPLGGIMPKIYHNGLLIVGDAASQVKPTTGGGVVFGLTCAKIAGEIASRAVDEGDCSERFLSKYQSGCIEAVGFDLAVMRLLRRRINGLSDEEVGRVFRIWRKFDVADALEKVGDLDYQGRSLLKVAKRPKALLGLAYSFFSTLFP
jgi:digeranylgeranylglycerophospholipid reductase